MCYISEHNQMTKNERIKRNQEKLTNDKLNKWNKWLDIIYREIRSLVTFNRVFKDVINIIQNNPKLNSQNIFYDYLFSSYASLILSGIRRQIKEDKDSISLLRFLNEIIESPQIISQEFFINNYKNTGIEEISAINDFNQFAGEIKSYVDNSKISNDVKLLMEKAKILELYADKIIAHCDSSPPKNIPKFEEIDIFLMFLEDLLKKYFLLLRGTCIVKIEPTFQYDWKNIFNIPWIN